uniref:Uncharacterized protein n=1 Tax=Triticum urartu TaxID=4572 RepID=A0A8R7UTK7_TRIUA
PFFPSLSSPPLPFQIRPRRHPPLPSLSSIQIAPPSLPSGITTPRSVRARRVLDVRIALPTSSPPRASQSYYQPTPADATPVTPRLPRWSPRRRSCSGSSSSNGAAEPSHEGAPARPLGWCVGRSPTSRNPGAARLRAPGDLGIPQERTRPTGKG